MNERDIFDFADEYGLQDVTGRWTFSGDKLINFARAIIEVEREIVANTVKARLDMLALDLWSEIRGEEA